MNYDCVIIGSGISGLSAALVLAQNGMRVAVLEQHKSIAPLLRRFKRRGVWCDPGVHYTGGFDDGGCLSVLFRYLKIDNLINILPLDSNGFDTIVHRDIGEISIPNGFNNVEETLLQQFPNSKKAVSRYIEKVEHLIKSTPYVNFDRPISDYENHRDNSENFYDFLKRNNAEDGLIELLGQYGYLLYGVKADNVSLYSHAMVMGTFYRSAHTFVRGGDEIVDALEQRLEEENVDIICDEEVVEIGINSSRKINSVKTANGNVFECRRCISTVHPHVLWKILPHEEVRESYLSRLKAVPNTYSPHIVFLDVEALPRRLHHRNNYVFYGEPGEYHKVLALLVCAPHKHSGAKKALCAFRPSFSTLPARRHYSERDARYQEYKEQETQYTLELLNRFLPELKGKYSLLDAATPYTLERYTGSANGAMYGTQQVYNYMTLDSKSIIKGLYLAGQSIVMPGIIGAIISGFLSASRIVGIRKFWNEVRIEL